MTPVSVNPPLLPGSADHTLQTDPEQMKPVQNVELVWGRYRKTRAP